MEDVMPKVGKAICDAYHWVPTDHPIFFSLAMLVVTERRMLLMLT